MLDVFDKIQIESIALVINELFDKSLEDYEDVSAQQEILNMIARVFSKLNTNMKRQVFFELNSKYDLYRECHYSYRPIDYIIALGDIELLSCLRQINFDFNKLNLLDACPIETLIVFNSVVRDTMPAIRLLVNEYGAQITPQVRELVEALNNSDDEKDEENDDPQLFLDDNQTSLGQAKMTL